MKYTEFIKKMNSLGFSVDTTHPMTLICKRVNADKVVMYISKMRKNSIVINMAISEPNEMMAIKWATKLARTPLNDRITPSKYEIILPGLYTVTGRNLGIVEYNGRYFVSSMPSLCGKYVFSESDMLNVPKKYHSYAKDIETGEPYIAEGVSL